jgi:hypothetical protein
MTYEEIINKRVCNGWNYPSAVVTLSRSWGCRTNAKYYYIFDGSKFNYLAFLPDNHGTTERSKYFLDWMSVKEAQEKLPTYNFQEFIKLGVSPESR